METITKEEEKQKEIDRLIDDSIGFNQSSLIDKMLNDFIFEFDDIENSFIPFGKYGDYKGECEFCQEQEQIIDAELNACKECYLEYNENTHEIFEWWPVDDCLAYKIEEIGSPILRNEYGNWWGRTETGLSLTFDSTLTRVAKENVS